MHDTVFSSARKPAPLWNASAWKQSFALRWIANHHWKGPWGQRGQSQPFWAVKIMVWEGRHDLLWSSRPVWTVSGWTWCSRLMKQRIQLPPKSRGCWGLSKYWFQAMGWLNSAPLWCLQLDCQFLWFIYSYLLNCGKFCECCFLNMTNTEMYATVT